MVKASFQSPAILITDRDRQELEDFLQWLRSTRPDLVAKAKNITYPEPSKLKQIIHHTANLAIVHPDSLHGHYRVTPELKKSAQATAVVMTASNLIDAIGNSPCFFFAFKSLTFVPAFGIACLMTVGVLMATNAVSVGAAQGARGRWGFAIASLLFGLIPLNILQTAATGIGVEIFNNQSELAQLRASDSLEKILNVKTDKLAQAQLPKVIQECQQEKRALESMPRTTPTEEKAFQSRYVRIYGTFKSQQQPLTLPAEQLPLCVRANQVQATYQTHITSLQQDIDTFKSQRAELGNDLTFLKQIAPAQYQKTFIESRGFFPWETEEKIELRSGIELVTLSTRSFLHKVQQGQWDQLGLNLFLVGISAITSLASIAMAIGFSLSQDNQNSYDHQEKEKIDRWFQKLRITLSALHKEQLQELEQSQQDFQQNNDDIENYN